MKGRSKALIVILSGSVWYSARVIWSNASVRFIGPIVVCHLAPCCVLLEILGN